MVERHCGPGLDRGRNPDRAEKARREIAADALR